MDSGVRVLPRILTSVVPVALAFAIGIGRWIEMAQAVDLVRRSNDVAAIAWDLGALSELVLVLTLVLVGALVTLALFAASSLPRSHREWVHRAAVVTAAVAVLPIIRYWSEIWTVTGLSIDWLD